MKWGPGRQPDVRRYAAVHRYESRMGALTRPRLRRCCSSFCERPLHCVRRRTKPDQFDDALKQGKDLEAASKLGSPPASDVLPA
jgi:hypothetical protein